MWDSIVNWTRDRARNAYNVLDNDAAKTVLGFNPITAVGYWGLRAGADAAKSDPKRPSDMGRAVGAFVGRRYAGGTGQAAPAQAVSATPNGSSQVTNNSATNSSTYDQWQQQWNAQQQQYKAQAAFLTAQELGRIMSARRAANSEYDLMKSENEYEAGAAESAYKLTKNDLARQAARAGRNLERTLGAKGMASSPRYMETGLVDIRDDQLAQQAQAFASRGDTLERLTLALGRQQRIRDNTIAGLDEEEALLSSSPDRMIYGVRF